MSGRRGNMTVECLPEQDRERVTCEFIHNADILKFSFPGSLSPEEMRGRVEVVAKELLANSPAPVVINVNAGDNNTLIAGGSNNSISTATANDNSTACAGAR
jgi:hypothetical protein